MSKKCILILIALVSMLSCARKQDVVLPDLLQTARSYRWIDVPKSDSILQQIDTSQYNAMQLQYWTVSQISTAYGLTLRLPEEKILDSLLSICQTMELNDLCAEIYYLKGSMHLWTIDSSVMWFKKAEEHLLLTPDPKPLLSVIYSRLGTLSDVEYLFHLSYHYNELANKYCTSNTPHLKYSCFREMASRCPYVFEDFASLQEELFDSALYYAKMVDNPLMEHEIYLLMALEKDDPWKIFLESKYLCDSCFSDSHSGLVAQYYLNNKQLHDAEKYLNIYKASFGDSGFDFSRWNTRKYHYLTSRYLYETGHHREAFEMMRALNDSIDEVMDRTARVRTYAISRAFDVEKEKAANLELTNQRQHLRIIIITIVSLLIIVFLIFAMFINRQRVRHEREEDRLRMAHEAEKAELQHQIDFKNSSLATKREMLTRELKKRLALAREAQIVKMKKTETITDGLIHILFDDKQLEMIVLDFNEATEAYLEALAASHPQLTKADCRLIAFDLLGLSNEDICIILQQETSSIWTRRRRTKEHLGIEGNRYYDWLQEDLNRHINHYSIQQTIPVP